MLISHGVPLYLKILASIFYMISMILGVGGNTFVLLIFIYYQRTKSVTQFFIINLAISDLIFAILCIPSTYITAYMIQYWPFSEFLCIFSTSCRMCR
jgi:neuropeptide Y receptor